MSEFDYDFAKQAGGGVVDYMGEHYDPYDNTWQMADSLSTGEFSKLSAGRAFDQTTTALFAQDMRIASAEREAGTYHDVYEAKGVLGEVMELTPNPKAMTQEDWKNSAFYRKEITYTNQMTEQRAQILAEDFDERRRIDALLSRGNTGFGRTVLGFGAALIGSLPDPINFVPIFGAAGKGASVGTRALRAGAEGAISTALADAVIMPELNRRGEDLGFEDFALDVMFGGVLGAGLGGMTAAAGDFLRARRVKALGALDTATNNVNETEQFSDFDTNVDGFYNSFSENIARGGGVSRQQSFFADGSVDQDTMRTLFLDHGMNVDEANALTIKMFDGVESRHLDDESLHEMAAVMRKSIGGDVRARMGLFMEDLLQQTTRNSSSPIDYTALAEKYKMGEVYDKIYQEIVEREVSRLDANEVLLVMRPDGEEPLVLERGPSMESKGDGLPIVTGGNLKRITGSRGYGMVKILIKHGEFSNSGNKVTRADMMRIPSIIREFESFPNEKGNRTWVVEREDGTQLVVGEGDNVDGAKRVVTVFVPEKQFEKPLSTKKAFTESHSRGSQPSQVDTTEGTFYRDTSEPVKANVATSNIADTKDIGIVADDVKNKETDEILDFGTEMEAQRLIEAGKATPEDLEALAKIDAEKARLEAVQNAAMGSVNCVYKATRGM